MNRDVASEMLRMLGCEIAQASDGASAVQAVARQREAGAPFDAVLMDLQMPVMNGLEAAAAIRTLEGAGGTRLPIIALTGFTSAEGRRRCLEEERVYRRVRPNSSGGRRASPKDQFTQNSRLHYGEDKSGAPWVVRSE